MTGLDARTVDLRLTPAELLARWPEERPLAVLWSGDASPASRRWSRWTLFAQPEGPPLVAAGPGALDALPLAELNPLPTPELPPGAPPFMGGWIGSISYELGRELEPLARRVGGPPPSPYPPHPPHSPHPWPQLLLHACPAALAFDHATGRWWTTGEPAAARRLIELAASWLPAPSRAFGVGPLSSTSGRARYTQAAARAIEYILAGDIYQANLAHHLTGRFSGDARALFANLVGRTRPWCGAYLELPEPRQAVLSMSPELFLEVDPRAVPGARRVITRPMKGTRPAQGASAEELVDHPKDLAELNMIIDLMRNDLGRVAVLGSVEVDEARVIERHGVGAPAVLQGVATVSATLRPDATLGDLLRATFPGGSVTGAPKIRAMQIIEELEPFARGPYCGSIGYLSRCGRSAFNIAIRTAHIVGPADPAGGPGAFAPGAGLHFPVGAGIVADSDPQAEWRETLDKAGAIIALSATDRELLEAT